MTMIIGIMMMMNRTTTMVTATAISNNKDSISIEMRNSSRSMYFVQ